MSRRRDCVRCCQRRSATRATDGPSAPYRPEAGLLALNRSVRAAHHGCGLSRDVTTKSVRSLPQLEQRNRSWSAARHPGPAR